MQLVCVAIETCGFRDDNQCNAKGEQRHGIGRTGVRSSGHCNAVLLAGNPSQDAFSLASAQV